MNNGGEKNDTNAKMEVRFISTQLLNELSYKVPVAQVLKEIERFSNPEQSGLSSSICLEDVCIWTQWIFLHLCHFLFRHRYRINLPNHALSHSLPFLSPPYTYIAFFLYPPSLPHPLPLLTSTPSPTLIINGTSFSFFFFSFSFSFSFFFFSPFLSPPYT